MTDVTAPYLPSQVLSLGYEESLLWDGQTACTLTSQNTSSVSLIWLKPDFSLRTVLPLQPVAVFLPGAVVEAVRFPRVAPWSQVARTWLTGDCSWRLLLTCHVKSHLRLVVSALFPSTDLLTFPSWSANMLPPGPASWSPLCALLNNPARTLSPCNYWSITGFSFCLVLFFF